MQARLLELKIKLSQDIQAIKQIIKKLPEYNLICSKIKDWYRWYNSDGLAKTYIPKKEAGLAIDLAYKKYYQSLLNNKMHQMYYCEHLVAMDDKKICE